MIDKLKELKNKISVIENSDQNIENWNKLKGKELIIIPTDSECYMEFQEWKNNNPIVYNSTGTSPIFLNEQVDELLELLIQIEQERVKEYKEELSKILEG